MDYLLIAAGLFLLFIGGEGLVRGSVALSLRLGISTLLIGMVVVGFGTSMPELMVSLQASLGGQPAIALGNVVGSNIANILLILGVGALICPIICADKVLVRDMAAVLLASLLLLAFIPFGVIGRLAGIVMIGLLVAYVLYAYVQQQKTPDSFTEPANTEDIPEQAKSMSVPIAALWAAGGIAILVAGAALLVDGAVSLATRFGISQAVIGLSLVAVGTSLPELATSVVAAIKKNSDVIMGNVLGSNLFNILLILGATGLIMPIPLDPQMAVVDIPVMIAVALLAGTLIVFRKKIGRLAGISFLALYVAYMAWLFLADAGAFS